MRFSQTRMCITRRLQQLQACFLVGVFYFMFPLFAFLVCWFYQVFFPRSLKSWPGLMSLPLLLTCFISFSNSMWDT
ncbi:hypothetical protein BDP55DRAFT_664738, partial [Colletotrichum godetiae]